MVHELQNKNKQVKFHLFVLLANFYFQGLLFKNPTPVVFQDSSINWPWNRDLEKFISYGIMMLKNPIAMILNQLTQLLNILFLLRFYRFLMKPGPCVSRFPLCINVLSVTLVV